MHYFKVCFVLYNLQVSTCVFSLIALPWYRMLPYRVSPIIYPTSESVQGNNSYEKETWLFDFIDFQELHKLPEVQKPIIAEGEYL